ncbi:hypothetical protein CDD81_1285 [Ophiocordyceps australis]|uniref:Peptidase M20 dimerisation domain-containing protein n=1 Tax=Ophiocordyceps australis TaxID=1399860 RepID=A0A2C5XWB0_9HYPO|nr:hypothetical protein CDD81_1285 [Ophiocordyceps australis]
MARLALTDEDGRVRQWFAAETEKLGCSLVVDEMGNMFARREGRRAGGEGMIAMGSHLDTQPRGGRYDGILGVVAAVEVMRTLAENGYETEHDVGIVNWTNEEGARFPKSMVASGVWAGAIPLDEAWQLADVSDASKTLKSELDRLGYAGSVACSSEANPLRAYFELHIEQGPKLERAGKRIGVVQGAQAYRWLTITLAGRDAHTGTTPLEARSDAILAAAKMIAASNAIAKQLGGLASTGIFKTSGGGSASVNTVGSQVAFSLDIRHAQDAGVAELERRCLEAFAQIADEQGTRVQLAVGLDTDSPAVLFDAQCIAAVERAAGGLVGGQGWMPIVSGAGHDAVYTSRKCPTAMIFVPCKEGVSHHPQEFCSAEDCVLGAQALLEAVVQYDGRVAKRA